MDTFVINLRLFSGKAREMREVTTVYKRMLEFMRLVRFPPRKCEGAN